MELTLFDQGDELALRWVLDDDLQEPPDPFTVQVSETEFALLRQTGIHARRTSLSWTAGRIWPLAALAT